MDIFGSLFLKVMNTLDILHGWVWGGILCFPAVNSVCVHLALVRVYVSACLFFSAISNRIIRYVWVGSIFQPQSFVLFFPPSVIPLR